MTNSTKLKDLPLLLVMSEIMPLLENPVDKLNFACSYKPLYHEFFSIYPNFRHGKKEGIRDALRQLIEFVRVGDLNLASWGFRCGRRTFVITRTGKRCYFHINNIPREISIDLALDIFARQMLIDRDNLGISMKCNYNSPLKKIEYQELTQLIANRIYA